MTWPGAACVGRQCRTAAPDRRDNDWYRLDRAARERLSNAFDAVLMRKDPPFDMEYVYSTYLLEHAESQGARCSTGRGDPRPQRENGDRASSAVHGTTRWSPAHGTCCGFLGEHGDIILKPLDGMGGSSIFRVRAGDPNINVIIETLTQFGART
jgi:glutathione synthase